MIVARGGLRSGTFCLTRFSVDYLALCVGPARQAARSAKAPKAVRSNLKGDALLAVLLTLKSHTITFIDKSCDS
jgi:hypothetical protein